MKILIIGGGITGLSAAWYAHKRYPDAHITLLEKSGRLGGWIRTVIEGGFLFEKGPRTFQSGRSPHLLALIRDQARQTNRSTILPQGDSARTLPRPFLIRSRSASMPAISGNSRSAPVFPPSTNGNGKKALFSAVSSRPQKQQKGSSLLKMGWKP